MDFQAHPSDAARGLPIGWRLDSSEIVATTYTAATGDGSKTCIMCHSDTPGTSSATAPFSLTGLTTPPDAIMISTHSYFSVGHGGATGCTTTCHLPNVSACTNSRCRNLTCPSGTTCNYMRTDKPWAIDFLSPGPCSTSNGKSNKVPGCYDCHGSGCNGQRRRRPSDSSPTSRPAAQAAIHKHLNPACWKWASYATASMRRRRFITTKLRASHYEKFLSS